MKKIVMIAFFLIFALALVGCKEKETSLDVASETFENEAIMQGKVIKIENETMLVEPISGSFELNSADRFSVSTKKFDDSSKIQVGDIVEIKYDGYILETYPASFSNIYSFKVIAKNDATE